MKKTRNLKIYPKLRVRTWDNIIVPEIRLQGKWLEKLGFKEGGNIKIEQNYKKITITIIENKRINEQ